MISYPLTLKDVANADVVFDSIIVNGTSTVSVDVASSDAEPRKLKISHSVEGKSSTTRNAHLISFEKVKLDSQGVAQTLTVNLTVKKPRSSVFSVTDAADLLRMLFDFLTSSTAPTVDTTNSLPQILRGES
jgi:excinuclease UvrABC ATPase subunit